MGRHYKGAGLCRNPVTIKPADIKRPVWLLEMPKNPTRVLSAIQTAVIIASIIGFLWCLWKLPQEHDAYPDGFNQCTASSYRILNNKKKKCRRKTCTQQMSDEQNRVLKLHKFMQTLTTPRRVTHEKRMEQPIILQSANLEDAGNSVSAEDIVPQMKGTRFRREENATLEKAVIIADGTKTGEKTSARLQAEELNPSTTAITDGANEAVTSLSATESKLQEGLDTVSENIAIEPTSPLTSSYLGDIKNLLRGILIALVGFAVLVLSLIAIIMACIYQKRMQSAGQIQGNGCTITWCTCCVKYEGHSQECQPVLHESSTQSDCDFQEVSSDNSDMVDKNPFEAIATTDYLESLSLCDIPPDLEDLLIKKLDVRRKGESLYGWQKVGTEFGISRDDLNYLENAYKRVGGSPTKELLDIIGCLGRNAADLTNVLRSSEVNYPDIASLIEQHVRTQ